MAVRKKYGPALGRGLDALISTESVRTEGAATINEVDIALIDRNPNQPRREFDEAALDELADSIAEIGIIQPITLREMPNGRYQIIAGERRWRASQKAGLAAIPAYIRTASDENVMEMALVENIQRQDLNSIEIALAYQNLIDVYHLTQEKLSERVGKKRATVANYLRLLKLPAPVQVAIQNHEIDTGHARALLSLEDPKAQVKLFHEIRDKSYSVRQVEEIIKDIQDRGGTHSPSSSDRMEKNGGRMGSRMGLRNLSQNMEDLRGRMAGILGVDVKLSCTARGGGKVSFAFKDEDELRKILSIISRS